MLIINKTITSQELSLLYGISSATSEHNQIGVYNCPPKYHNLGGICKRCHSSCFK